MTHCFDAQNAVRYRSDYSDWTDFLEYYSKDYATSISCHSGFNACRAIMDESSTEVAHVDPYDAMPYSLKLYTAPTQADPPNVHGVSNTTD